MRRGVAGAPLSALLAAGTYYLAVSATAPTTLDVRAELSAPTTPPADETCDSGATLAPNVTTDLTYAQHQDDLALTCFANATDAAYTLDLAQASDVLLALRTSISDSSAVALLDAACDPAAALTCTTGTKSPVRSRRRNVAAGSYRVVTESALALPQQLTAFVRPYAPAKLVPIAEACGDAVDIPPEGAFLQGNTSARTADFSAGCDAAGGPPNGAPDQLLRLELTEEKRVVLDATGSGYDVLLDVRKGPSCPGTEVPLGCSATISGIRPYLDLTLQPGTYFVQIDGLSGAVGPWNLDVYVVDPP
ncbi:MAG: hypothetical protein U0271_17090 [Polyangiaceae bacterium]